MRELIKGRLSPYYCTENEMLFLGDTFSVLRKIAPASVTMIFADPPYFLSNDGITCHAGQMVSVNKGNWDKVSSVAEKHNFNRKWIRLCRDILVPNGTIWISGTLHNIYSIGMALEQEGFKIINGKKRIPLRILPADVLLTVPKPFSGHERTIKKPSTYSIIN